MAISGLNSAILLNISLMGDLGVPILGANIVMFIGIFLILESIFSIVYYFEGDSLPHVFRAIRSVFGAYLIWKGAYHSLFETIGFAWSQVALFIIVGLCILAGYEVAIIMEAKRD